MTKVLVLYHSSYGHIEDFAREVAAGAAEVEGVTVAIRRVPETMSTEAMGAAGMKLDQEAPVATVAELPEYDAIIVGTPTRFGNMSGQMRTFWDQTGGLWAKGALVGKIGSAFVSSATGGGNETTLASTHTTLLHHGMIVVGLPYAAPELTDISEPRGGSPLGAGMLAGPRGERQASGIERALARFQGRHVATIASKLNRA